MTLTHLGRPTKLPVPLLVAAIVLVAGCGGGDDSEGAAAEGVPGAAAVTSTTRCKIEGPAKRTATRTFVLHVLAPERIFTNAEAAKLRPNKGEVIYRGALTEQARKGSSAQTHVSVHVLSRASGQAVWEPYPMRVRLRRVDAKADRSLPVALMQGIGKGRCDRHYGTNVRLEPDARYRLTATLGTDTVTFVFKADGHAGHGG